MCDYHSKESVVMLVTRLDSLLSACVSLLSRVAVRQLLANALKPRQTLDFMLPRIPAILIGTWRFRSRWSLFCDPMTSKASHLIMNRSVLERYSDRCAFALGVWPGRIPFGRYGRTVHQLRGAFLATCLNVCHLINFEAFAWGSMWRLAFRKSSRS
jgi:hypothetical protein